MENKHEPSNQGTRDGALVIPSRSGLGAHQFVTSDLALAWLRGVNRAYSAARGKGVNSMA
eukprot:COSAG02_NODE_1305_length_13344_cov_3.237448_2_plen_60_part_00